MSWETTAPNREPGRKPPAAQIAHHGSVAQSVDCGQTVMVASPTISPAVGHASESASAPQDPGDSRGARSVRPADRALSFDDVLPGATSDHCPAHPEDGHAFAGYVRDPMSGWQDPYEGWCEDCGIELRFPRELIDD